MSVYVFDMDGTLTPARLPMTEYFALRFYEWQKITKVISQPAQTIKRFANSCLVM